MWTNLYLDFRARQCVNVPSDRCRVVTMLLVVHRFLYCFIDVFDPFDVHEYNTASHAVHNEWRVLFAQIALVSCNDCLNKAIRYTYLAQETILALTLPYSLLSASHSTLSMCFCAFLSLLSSFLISHLHPSLYRFFLSMNSTFLVTTAGDRPFLPRDAL